MPKEASWHHTNGKPISRAAGKSYVGLVAYTIDQPIYDEYNKRTCNRNHAGEVKSWGIVAGGPCPASFLDKSQIDRTANAYELSDTRINAHLSVHWDFALWRHARPEEHEQVVRKIAERYAERYGVLVVYSVHAPSGEGSADNWHGHLAPTTKRLTEDGFGEKARELQDGKTKKAELIWARRMIADEINAFLASVNSDERVTHESYEARGIDREAMRHMGNNAWQAEKRGIRTEIGDENRAIRARNAANDDEIRKSDDRIANLTAEIIDLEQERRTRARMETNPLKLTPEAGVEEWIAAVKLMVEQRDRADAFFRAEAEKNERAAKEEAELRQRGELKAREGDIANPMRREATARSYYNGMPPEQAAAAFAAAELAQFLREQEDLDHRMARENDHGKRKDLELRKEIERCDYQVMIRERLANLSKDLTGKTGYQTEFGEMKLGRNGQPLKTQHMIDTEHAKFWKDRGEKFREERRLLHRQQQQEAAPQNESIGLAAKLGAFAKHLELGNSPHTFKMPEPQMPAVQEPAKPSERGKYARMSEPGVRHAEGAARREVTRENDTKRDNRDLDRAPRDNRDIDRKARDIDRSSDNRDFDAPRRSRGGMSY